MSGACEYKPNYKKQKESVGQEEGQQQDKKLEIVRLVIIAAVTISVAWMHLLHPTWLANIVVVITVIVCGYPIFKESSYALMKGRVNMELSMVIAIVASLILFQFLPAVAITFFALLSELIEGFIVEKGRKNIEMLYRHTPKKAIVKKKKNNNNDKHESKQEDIAITTQEMPVSQIIIGDIIIAREGDVIPVDGHILKGTSTIDQSSITGESVPIEKNAGDSVFAGTINLTSQLEIKCEKLSTDTTFAKIIHLVEEAESSKAPIQKLSDRLATRLIQFAVGLSVLTFIVTQNIVSALSVIVVAGACGLAVGTPIALLASNTKLAKKGIIVKGGLQIENIRNAGTIVFDKTGTLTAGKPIVSQVISFDQRIEPKKVLEYAVIAEQNINHPLAKAIEKRAADEKIEINSRDNQSIIRSNSSNNDNDSDNNLVKVGRGVTVVTQNGHSISVGNMKFMEEQSAVMDNNNSIRNPSSFNLKFSLACNHQTYRCLLNIQKQNTKDSRRIQEEKEKKVTQSDIDNNNINNHLLFAPITTTAFVSLDGQIIGAIFLEDKLRNETRKAVSQIKSMGIRIVMLTGDNEKIAKRIAEEASIDEYYADLLPQDKVSKIEEIVESQKKERKKKKTVIMVGDGINDAPALAKADVGIAMGKTGTDIAVETADVVLMAEDLTKIPYLLRTSRQALLTVQQNFFATLFIDGLGFILAFAGIINPLLAAIIHVSSELIFMTNSARLLIDNREEAIRK